MINVNIGTFVSIENGREYDINIHFTLAKGKRIVIKELPYGPFWWVDYDDNEIHGFDPKITPSDLINHINKLLSNKAFW